MLLVGSKLSYTPPDLVFDYLYTVVLLDNITCPFSSSEFSF